MSSSEQLHDLAIIGAGPVGLYAAYYAGFRQLTTVVLDALPEAGGQITAMYPEKEIHDVAGFPSIRGVDLVGELLKQAGRYDYDLRLGQTIADLTALDDGRYQIDTCEGGQFHARAILIAAGLGKFTPKSLQTAPDPLPRGVMHFVPKLSMLDDQIVVVVGGGDSAVDWALAAVGRAVSTTIIHRRARFRAHEASVEEMKAKGVRVIAPGEIRRFNASSSIDSVVVEYPDGRTEELPCSALVMALGFLTDLRLFDSWELEREGIHIRVGSDMQTSRERIYAAGDVSEYPGKVRLISVGFGEAAIAVNHVAAALDPSQQIFPGHSTHEEH